MKNVLIALFSILFLHIYSLQAQSVDSTNKSSEKVKSGYNIGVLPAISFDSDLGFQYGLIANLFNYGDGTVYPDYKWSLYGEWSRTTKGSGTTQLFFDSKYILPHNIRITADISQLTEAAFDFYGFNGYEARYISEFEDDNPDNDLYISRMFYRMQKNMFRMSVDFQGTLFKNHKEWNWLAGLGRYHIKMSPVDLDKLNKGVKEEDKLPDVEGLYEKYVNWGFISHDEAEGGTVNSIKLGIIYDSRDNEASPEKGIWSEVLVSTSPLFINESTSAYSKLAVTHRQYIPVIAHKLIFAYRLGWQGTIGGITPFYMQPQMVTTFPRATQNYALGGVKTLRGILRNRIVGDAYALGNFELRYKFLKFEKWNQNFSLVLSGFSDIGFVTNDISINRTLVPDDEQLFYFDEPHDKPHTTIGAGLHIAMNQNFILAIDFGKANDKRDGSSGLYINIGYLF